MHAIDFCGVLQAGGWPIQPTWHMFNVSGALSQPHSTWSMLCGLHGYFAGCMPWEAATHFEGGSADFFSSTIGSKTYVSRFT